MKKRTIKVCWPNKKISEVREGDNWFYSAQKSDFNIPTGCLSGSCGACEIDVNGKTIRPCIKNIESGNQDLLVIKYTYDPYWN